MHVAHAAEVKVSGGMIKMERDFLLQFVTEQNIFFVS